MTASVFDNRRCELGEGPIWHPERQQLFWFDILGMQLMTRVDDTPRRWQFDEIVSAAGWIDHDRLLIASETRLFAFNLDSGEETLVCPLQADRPDTRSNDGRADRQGGFWIGTMGKAAEPGAGAIHRWYKGELRTLVEGIDIPNAICFSVDGTRAYYADSHSKRVKTLALDADGWPKGEAKVFLDLTGDGFVPDGAVTDSQDNLWIAHWGAYRVCCYDPDGTRIASVSVPGKNASCPAFGGPELDRMFVTSALEDLEPEESARSENGMTFEVDPGATGIAEPRVVLA